MKLIPCIMVFSTLATVSSTLVADPIYRTTDEFGRPVFTDQGAEDADVVELKQPTPFAGNDVFKEMRSRPKEDDQITKFRYTTASVTGPADGTTVRDNAGNLTLSVMLSPTLQDGHRLELLMDGAVYKTLKGPGTVQLENVDRGTHEFALQVTHAESGKAIITGPTTSITLMRHSVSP
ncbi:MAG: hypothetical protein O2780_12830 [Proteobacteria bacterium]|jgi:hypothetical protein|nr:hypothetical protein [Pseudomonadota bacterium]MDA1298769.1 hypothetical protein [Pseudomonadota bacterium]